jgi:hypothetical protein
LNEGREHTVGFNSERLNPTIDMGHDGDLTDGNIANDLGGRDAFGMSLGYYGDGDYKAIGPSWGPLFDRPSATTRSGTARPPLPEALPLYKGYCA